MRRFLFGLIAGIFLYISPTNASDEISFGLGMGAMYSGLGMNVGLRSENDFRYLSAGAIALGYSDTEGSIVAYGLGGGWIRSDLLPTSNDRHGLGVYLGPVGYRGRRYVGDPIETIYGAGVTYAYFLHGIGRPSTNLGLTLAAGENDQGDTSGYLLLQAGYQY